MINTTSKLQIVLIRPGSTDFDEQKRIKGTLNLPLNSNGATQVARTADELAEMEIDCIYFSPSQSAEQSARALANGREVKVKKIEAFANLDHGLWHGKLIEEVKQRQPRVYKQFQEHPENACPPEGETLVSAASRTQKALVKLLKKHKAGIIALVVPEPLASVIRGLLVDAKLSDLWSAECDTGCWELIDLSREVVAAMK
jgi:broad specificity phosphatase PhoE